MTIVGTAVNKTLIRLSIPGLAKLPRLVSLVILVFFCSITLQDKATSSKGRGTYFLSSYSLAILSSSCGIFGISITEVNTELLGNEATTLFVVTPAFAIRVLRIWAVCVMAEPLSLLPIWKEILTNPYVSKTN